MTLAPDHGDMSVLIILSHGDNGKIFTTEGRFIRAQSYKTFYSRKLRLFIIC
jgi:hypothetical protein